MNIEFMRLALKLSTKGIGYTNPNPLVGAVIVKDNQIIGQGYHKNYGDSHAEIEALINATEDVSGATMYVTLEPCSHYGNTPPCTEAIISKKISRVIIGMTDPNPLVSGRGIKLLQDHGIEVTTGILSPEIEKLNEIFIKYITTSMPFCIMKTAMSLDGKISTPTGESKWITGEIARNYVHKIRHQVSAIMVGIGTVLIDNPSLTTRFPNYHGKDPHRIILDTKASIPLDAKVLNIESESKTIIATTNKADCSKLSKLRDKGAHIIITPLKDGKVDLYSLMTTLGEMKIDSVLLEGGSELNFSALNENIVDKVITFIAPKIIGGNSSKTPVGGKGIYNLSDAFIQDNISIEKLGKDIKIESYIRK
ncbi:bifunctional diaminohydroxyphosphoribosylaminopyrimidine deaminase/5-amino-6-(5-phosphoribosylamino)uracil reductase RibD [Alkalibaculum sp. M08DMB]|uniref:Riboflavin biosynthesis protein RibD n=1 Tax=Alkalibaculum sporogenes TaxID=2655001 RepID=A0A6A7KBJ8_9FIRM|nr:bifunctional diaminohydroxyphosphoribosylaminopyrimidine deaminase/5-amino-6-(5-phosphoribosylamino)uracil reductase RibD [Alkalibaculum sporogenes]MPW26776.1 bifunctional diaminohydroxyphosphoribosylaminopyrimidine deaminase/5-amino-6-(5-phosphoribosylamino)uracil reductase RibD [Alkalibaculum sporogenes]